MDIMVIIMAVIAVGAGVFGFVMEHKPAEKEDPTDHKQE